MKIIYVLAFFIAFRFGTIAQQVIPLYADSVPNSTNKLEKEDEPTLEIYLPQGHVSTGASVIIFPGGAYSFLAYTEEGTQIAKTFAGIGITAFVVKYRLPKRETMKDKSLGPIMDAQQAIKTVRLNAVKWGIDTKKVGVIGYSTGGHLASTLGTHFNKNYIPNKENISLRPDFMILAYPVITMDDKLTHTGSKISLLGIFPSEEKLNLFSNERQVTNLTPPTYLTHCGDDQLVDVNNSIVFYQALQRNGVDAELHLFPKGNHGFTQRLSIKEWIDPMLIFLFKEGFLDSIPPYMVSYVDFTVSGCFSNNMVLQRNQQDPIWGTANPGTSVNVEFGQKKYEAKADVNGQWRVKLDVGEAGGPFVMKVTAGEKILEFNNILVGEVWVCSGQSNMEMPLEGWSNGDGTYRIPIKNYEQEIADAKYPNIRLLQVETRSEEKAATDVKAVGGMWRQCSPKTIRTFSSTAYFFAREVYKRTGIPIGLIESSVGGSIIEAWCDFKPIRKGTAKLYNGMIAPIIPYGIRGVLWYQGEFNSSNAWEYQTLLPNMIKDWRAKWGQGDFPFYYMQLPIIGDPSNGVQKSGWVELRDAQFKTLSVSNTAMSVSIDLPDNDLHPANKQDFGYRFALIALSKLYGKKNTYVGPLYQSCKTEGNAIRITFSNTEGGILSRNNEVLKGFFIAGPDSVFHEGKARIEGGTIVVSAE